MSEDVALGEPAAAPPRLEPTPPPTRLSLVDAMRGAALAGILLANIRGFAAPADVYFNHKDYWTLPADVAVQSVVDIFVQGKFITMFAFLFGLGFAAQFERAEARGGPFALVYCRRLAILLLIGLLHGFAIWWGDILAPYALTGFALLWFRGRTNRTCLWWATVLYMIPVVFFFAGGIAAALGHEVPSPPKATAQELADTIRIYASGTFGEIAQKRAAEARLNYGFSLFYAWRLAGLFLFGAVAWRARVFQNTARSLAVLRRWIWLLAGLGIPGNLGIWWAERALHLDLTKPSLAGAFLGLAGSVTVPALSALYVALLLFAWRHAAWQKRLQGFAAVGRMALTNYLLQSVVCTLLFNSYGLGMFGKWGPAWLLLPTAGVYGAQLLWSPLWLARYRFGPAEWLWRSLTYGARQPVRAQSF